MRITRGSIRNKIIFGYVVSIAFLLMFAAVLFVDLVLIEEQTRNYTVTTQLLDTVLEIRRFEKNYLLYGNEDDFNEVLQFVDIARESIGKAEKVQGEGLRARLGVFSDRILGDETVDPLFFPEASEVSRLLGEYREVLMREGPTGQLSRTIEERVRHLGRDFTDIVERLAGDENVRVANMLSGARTSLVVLVGVFLVGLFVIAQLVIKVALSPLKELEKGLQMISAGGMEMLPDKTGVREVDSMNQAFNRMIREIFEQRQEVLSAEKLASLGTMLAGIAHEINNPLSNISTSAEILREEMDSGDPSYKTELIAQITSETDRATRIIQTVLEYTRERKFERRDVNLLGVVQETMTLIRGKIPTYISLNIEIPEHITLSADRQRLAQVFINLVNNAVDAMRNLLGECRIDISARAVEGEAVEIRFSDSGPGIPADIRHRIFDPFFTTKDVGRGTGLGLYLAHQIVEQHFGTLRLETEEVRGTTFIITLPGKDT